MKVYDTQCVKCGNITEIFTETEYAIGEVLKDRCVCGGELRRIISATGCMTIKSFGKYSPCGMLPFKYNPDDRNDKELSDKETYISLVVDEKKGKVSQKESKYWRNFFKRKKRSWT